MEYNTKFSLKKFNSTFRVCIDMFHWKKKHESERQMYFPVRYPFK